MKYCYSFIYNAFVTVIQDSRTMSFDVGQTILGELMTLTGKTELRCDAKIYKESRNFSLGEYVLSHVAAVELGLEQDDRASCILGTDWFMFTI